MKNPESQTYELDNEGSPPSETVSRSRRSKQVWLWLLPLLLLGGGIAVWRILTPAGEPTSPTATQELPPRPVTTVAVKSGNGVSQIRLLGQVEATTTATVRAQTGGLVEQVLVEVGDSIRAGMPVVILENSEQRLALTEAEAGLAQERSELARLEVGTREEVIAQRQAELRSAQAQEREAEDNLRRTTELVAEGAVSTRLLVEARAAADAAQAGRLQAEAVLAEATAGPTREEIGAQRASVAAAAAAVNQARLTLERTRITALADGIVQSREVSPGDLVESGDAVLALVGSKTLDIFLELPEDLSGRVTPGLPVELVARALPNWRGQATISGVVPAASAASRRQMVRVRLENPPQGLLPKMAIQGELQLQSDVPSVVVPRDAMIRRDEGWLVYTVADGKAQEVEVELVADMGETMAIHAATPANANNTLQVGQPVVVQGAEGLMDGAPVQVNVQDSSLQN